MKAFGKHPATLADLRALPDSVIGELIAGELIASPRPSIPHARVQFALSSLLGPPFDRAGGGGDAPGGWWFAFEPELHLGADVLVPDLAGWRRSRVATPPASAAMKVAPDWVCEVLSPSTAAVDRVVKMAVYLREGVGHVWLVDPAARTLEAFERDGARWVVAGGYTHESDARIRPFDSWAIDVASLWSESAP